jgi:hypothetical protein
LFFLAVYSGIGFALAKPTKTFLGSIMKKLLGLAMVAIALSCSDAGANVITAPAAPFIPFPVLNYLGSGPVSFGPGITWTNTNVAPYAGSFGYNGLYGFGDNGDNQNGMGGFYTVTALNNGSEICFLVPGYCDPPDSVANHTTKMIFAFDTPVSSVGGFLNWAPSTLPVTIAAYDANWTLLDTLELSENETNLVAPNSFYGFQEDSADISYFVLQDGYIGIYDGLNGTKIGMSVPEPLTASVFGIGVAGAAFLRRRKAKKV